MNAIEHLNNVIAQQTKAFRKGDVVRHKERDGLRVTTIDAFPSTPLNDKVVDVHFVNVGFTEAAADRDAFISATRAATGHGEFQALTAEDLKGGPSYITIGGWLGSQQLALQFMALCEFHGVGQVITPAKLGMEGEIADKVAGSGFVMATCDLEKAPA